MVSITELLKKIYMKTHILDHPQRWRVVGVAAFIGPDGTLASGCLRPLLFFAKWWVLERVAEDGSA